jgi:hypothetical protein
MATVSELIDKAKVAWEAEGKKSLLGPSDTKLLTDISGISLIMHSFYLAISKAEPEDIVQAAQMLYRTKEKIDQHFPIKQEHMNAMGSCPVCITDERKEGEPCPHRSLVRASILLMSMLRHYPEPDLDLTPDAEEAEAL